MGDLVDLNSPAQAKIALFRALFRGREDVYPRRFESLKTGKSGYAPACANEWVRGICRKPEIKCADCVHRRFLPVTDEVIYGHLSGHETSGVDRAAVRMPTEGRMSEGGARTFPIYREGRPREPLRQPRPFVAGVYPLLEDETCFFLAVDSTSPAGTTTPRRSSGRADVCICPRRSSGHARAKAATSGFSSKRPCRLRWQDGSGPTF